ncbi:Ubiquitin carboxyl-terminal hydrolase isozyme L3 [Neolecta irregularis DAH-3]|uniref:Ubiquitin carboxyl-terminal hydrolase n=1 Tax=Neolecta irregularis (strain DAH-3) TaxID=1198029 RepID=A0A1U7LSV1_NEOID|nr:Ubiquitin carboxyl-terminal hydrolase isozyme L3 [Neolecta irregularis DAH-3]|eukprot:OLL25750.1 Ubiquitin carboxyl-terminal hydrolase isozyme L3 [Neolecta irregularis DAH-3]
MAAAFVPVENNPALLTRFSRILGLEKNLAFHDVYSLDLLDLIPRPAKALLLVFPLSQAYQHSIPDDDARFGASPDSKHVCWIKQTIKNACGTIALLHSIANNGVVDNIVPASALNTLITELLSRPAAERPRVLETSSILADAHKEMASQGDSAPPDADQDTNLHFVCYTRGTDGHIYELDGRRSGPLDRGILPDDQDLLGEAVITLIRQFIQREQSNIQFSLVALSPSLD